MERRRFTILLCEYFHYRTFQVVAIVLYSSHVHCTMYISASIFLRWLIMDATKWIRKKATLANGFASVSISLLSKKVSAQLTIYLDKVALFDFLAVNTINDVSVSAASIQSILLDECCIVLAMKFWAFHITAMALCDDINSTIWYRVVILANDKNVSQVAIIG